MNPPLIVQTPGNAMPLDVTFASQAEPGDRVEGFGTVVEAVEVTDKTATIAYEPFPEYVQSTESADDKFGTPATPFSDCAAVQPIRNSKRKTQGDENDRHS